MDELIGKKIEKIELSADKETLSVVADGERYLYRVCGECCSSSWIEHLEGADSVIGGTVTQVEELDMNANDEKEHCELCKNSDVLSVYQTLIKTEKGTATLEYRNDSNGYYGGYIQGGKVSI